VVEVPLLFESGLDAAFDATVAVVADEEVRRQRAGARGHASLDERTARQLTQEEKAERATYTVANSGSIEELEKTLSQILDKLNG
jgi:dephospho-CoA kinase